MDGWIDGWMDGWMDGWEDGWMSLSLLQIIYKQKQQQTQRTITSCHDIENNSTTDQHAV